MGHDGERRARAEARRRGAILAHGRLGRLERDLSPVRGAEAISLVTRLTAESWSLARLPQPTYPRAAIPCRFVRGRR